MDTCSTVANNVSHFLAILGALIGTATASRPFRRFVRTAPNRFMGWSKARWTTTKRFIRRRWGKIKKWGRTKRNAFHNWIQEFKTRIGIKGPRTFRVGAASELNFASSVTASSSDPSLERRVELLEGWKDDAAAESTTAAKILAAGFLLLLAAEVVDWVWC